MSFKSCLFSKYPLIHHQGSKTVTFKRLLGEADQTSSMQQPPGMKMLLLLRTSLTLENQSEAKKGGHRFFLNEQFSIMSMINWS
jgi:hypothetical protein